MFNSAVSNAMMVDMDNVIRNLLARNDGCGTDAEVMEYVQQILEKEIEKFTVWMDEVEGEDLRVMELYFDSIRKTLRKVLELKILLKDLS